MIERQELYCHGCGRYVQFNLDLALNGNHVLQCPVCGHTHYRVAENGQITGIRWNIMAGPYIPVSTGTTSSCVSTYDTYSGSDQGTVGNSFLYGSWTSAGTTY